MAFGPADRDGTNQNKDRTRKGPSVKLWVAAPAATFPLSPVHQTGITIINVKLLANSGPSTFFSRSERFFLPQGSISPCALVQRHSLRSSSYCLLLIRICAMKITNATVAADAVTIKQIISQSFRYAYLSQAIFIWRLCLNSVTTVRCFDLAQCSYRISPFFTSLSRCKCSPRLNRQR